MIPRPVRRLLSFALPLVLVLAHASVAPAQGNKKRAAPDPSPKTTASPSTGASASPAPPYVLPDVVATVDGESINKKDLERLTQNVLASSGKAIQDLPPASQKEVYASMLNNMIVDKLASKASAGEKVEPIDIEKQYAAIVGQYPNPRAFEDQVKKSGQTPDDIKATLRRQIAQQQWVEKSIADSLKVAPQEVEKFYKEGPPSKFDAPETIRARHILVAVRKDAPPEDAYVAEQKINELAKRVKGGEDFGKVAKAESDDKAARTNSGDLDYFSRDKIMPEFSDAAFKLKVGEVSAPVRTQFGYHLIKLEDRKPAHTATLDEARDQITAYLQAQKRQQATADLIRGLQEKAQVSVFLP